MHSIEDIEKAFSAELPEDYRRFLSTCDEEFLASNDCTLLYGLSCILERNDTFEVHEYCPGSLSIGDDSGGSQIMLRLNDGTIHRVDAGAMTEDCFEQLAASFADWETRGFPYEAT